MKGKLSTSATVVLQNEINTEILPIVPLFSANKPCFKISQVNAH